MSTDKKVIMGIDPGVTGGIAIIDLEGRIQSLLTMPHNAKRFDISAFIKVLAELLEEWEIVAVGLEKVTVEPKFGSSSAFTYGQYFGEVKASIIAAGLRMQLVSTNEWQRIMHRGASSKLEGKKRSLEAANLLWPNANFLATPHCRVPHDGLYEAALIAEYTRRTHLGLTLAPKGEVAEEAPHAP